MPIAFAKNQTAVAEHNSTNGVTTLKTDPQPMGGMNYCTVILNVESYIDVSSGTPEIKIQGEGSNDGVQYATIASLVTAAATGTGLNQISADVTFAFLRFSIELDAKSGGAGEWAAATYDIHANLTQK